MDSKTKVYKKRAVLLVLSIVLGVSLFITACGGIVDTPSEPEAALKIARVAGYPDAVIDTAAREVSFEVADGIRELSCDCIIFNDDVKHAEFYSDEELQDTIDVFVLAEGTNLFFVKLSNDETFVVWTISIVCGEDEQNPGGLSGIEPLDCVTTYELYDSAFIGEIKLTYQSDETAVIPITDAMLTGFDTMSTGEKTVTVSYGGLSFDLSIQVTTITRTTVSEEIIKDMFATALAAYDLNEYLTDNFFRQYSYYYDEFFGSSNENYKQITVSREILERAGMTNAQLESLQTVLNKQIKYCIKLQKQYQSGNNPYYAWLNMVSTQNIAEQKAILNELTDTLSKDMALKIATTANVVLAGEYDYPAISNNSVIAAVLSVYETIDCVQSIGNGEIYQTIYFIIDIMHGREPYNVNISIKTFTKAINLLGDILKIQTAYPFEYSYFTYLFPQDAAELYTQLSSNRAAIEFVAETLSSISPETVALLVMDLNDYVMATNDRTAKEAILIARVCSVLSENYQKLSAQSKASLREFVDDVMGMLLPGFGDVDVLIANVLKFGAFNADALTVPQINQITTYFNTLKA